MKKYLCSHLRQWGVLCTVGLSLTQGFAQQPPVDPHMADLGTRIDHIQVRPLDMGAQNGFQQPGAMVRMEIIAYDKAGLAIPLSSEEANALFDCDVKNNLNSDVAHMFGNQILSDNGRNYVWVQTGNDQGAARLEVNLKQRYGKKVFSPPALISTGGTIHPTFGQQKVLPPYYGTQPPPINPNGLQTATPPSGGDDNTACLAIGLGAAIAVGAIAIAAAAASSGGSGSSSSGCGSGYYSCPGTGKCCPMNYPHLCSDGHCYASILNPNAWPPTIPACSSYTFCSNLGVIEHKR